MKKVKKLTEVVTLYEKISDRKQRIVKKVMWIKPNRQLPTEIEALGKLPDCNRIVKPVHYSLANPDPSHGTSFWLAYPHGDLLQWREATYEALNWKAVPESYVWRCFLQLSQALAVCQNKLEPNRSERPIYLHRDLKAQNILVVNNGTTYPSFALHDFGVAREYYKPWARLPSICASFSWQAAENPLINTTAAGVWGLGAIIHFLAIGDLPIE